MNSANEPTTCAHILCAITVTEMSAHYSCSLYSNKWNGIVSVSYRAFSFLRLIAAAHNTILQFHRIRDTFVHSILCGGYTHTYTHTTISPLTEQYCAQFKCRMAFCTIKWCLLSALNLPAAERYYIVEVAEFVRKFSLQHSISYFKLCARRWYSETDTAAQTRMPTMDSNEQAGQREVEGWKRTSRERKGKRQGKGESATREKGGERERESEKRTKFINEIKHFAQEISVDGNGE